jgi:hypothetical protein
VKIKDVRLETRGYYVRLILWLMLPDVYTFWWGIGQGDRDWLELCWKEKRLEDIEKFMERTRLSLCRGSIKIGARGGLPKKKFSWTRLKGRTYGIWTELNAPKPPMKNTRDVPISRITHFLTLLEIPSNIKIIPNLKDYITLYILKRDYGKNIR